MRRYWTCRCGARNERNGGRLTCAACGTKAPKPRKANKLKPVDDYPVYLKAAVEIHGIEDESCCVCGKPRSQERRHDRDHDHVTGHPRGLACGGNSGCNIMMARWVTPEAAHALAEVLKPPLGDRWRLIALYLERVEYFYARQAA